MLTVDNAKRELGALIRSIRLGCGMKREIFAEKCQLGEQIINRIERGKGSYNPSLIKLVLCHLVLDEHMKVRVSECLKAIYHPPRRRLGPVFRKSFD